MPKALPQTYEPTTPPIRFEDWPRWIDAELHRVQQAITSQPVVMTVSGSGTIDIDTVPSIVILGIGDDAILDVPEGSWDPVTGNWICSLGGLYGITLQCFIAAFGPGNKSYFATLEIFVNDVTRAVQLVGGADDVPLGLSLSTSLALVGKDIVRVELTTVHEQFTGSSTYNYSMSFLRNAIL